MRKALYILGQLTDADVDWLARTGTRRRMEKDEVMVREGGVIDALFITLDGKFSVRLGSGREVARLGVGEIVGEIAFVDAAPPSATVVTLGDAFVLELKRADLERKLGEDIAFAVRFYRAIAIFLADRLRAATHGLGYGGDPVRPAIDDEMELGALDTVSMAGSRFERLLRTLAAGA
jgi:CRP/FNR family transcriptional regulator, cyclic AMP receptor protein